MLVKSRPVDFKKDLPDLQSWWTTQDWPKMGLNMLGDHGYIAEDLTGAKLAAAWLLPIDTTELAFVEWIVGNPKVPHEIKGIGIQSVIDACVDKAAKLGKKSLITMVKNERLINRLKSNCNFKETESGMTHLVRGVK